MKRIIKRTCLFLASLLLFILILGIVLFYTSFGFRFIISTVNYFLKPHDIHISETKNSGYLGDFYLNQLTIKTDSTTVIIDGIKVNWIPQALMLGMFRITSVDANKVTVIVNTDDSISNAHKDDDKDGKHSPFKWPLPLNAKNVSVKKIEVKVDDLAPIITNNFNAKVSLYEDQLKFSKGYVTYPLFPTKASQLAGSLTLNEPYILKASLNAKAIISNINLNFNININSPLIHYFYASSTLQGNAYNHLLSSQIDFKADHENVLLKINQFDSAEFKGQGFANYDIKSDYFSLNIDGSHPRKFHPTLLDRINFNNIFSITQKDQVKSINFNQCYLTFNRLSKSCEFQLDMSFNAINIKNFKIGNSISANGEVYPNFNLSWQIILDDLNNYFSDYQGTFKTEGYIYGPYNSPGLSVLMTLNHFSYFNQPIGNLSFRASLNQMLLQADLKFKGNNDINADIKLNGKRNKNHWALQFEQSKLQANEFGHWYIIQPKPITFDQSTLNFQIPTLCLTSTTQFLCGKLNFSPITYQGGITAHLDPTPWIQFYLPQLSTQNGYFNINSNFYLTQFLPSWISAQLNVDKTQVELTAPSNALNQSIQSSTLDYLHLNFAQIGSQVIFNGKTSMNNKSKINFNVQLDDAYDLKSLMHAPIKGDLNVIFPEISLLSFVVKYPLNLTGSFFSHLKFRGNVNKPVVSGEAQLKDTNITLYNFNTQIKNINLLASGSQYQWILKGDAFSNNNPINLAGELKWENGLYFKSTVKGNKLLLVNIPPMKIIASPDLSFSYDKLLKFSGSIDIDEAKIQADNLPNLSSNNAMIQDIVYVNQNNQPLDTSKPTPFKMNLHLNLGNDLKVYGFGIQTYLLGQITIKSLPQQSPFGIGKISLKDAIYTYYGKEFHITDNSSLTFTNSDLDNPYLNITANYQIPAQQQLSTNAPENIGVHITGPLKNPTINFFSTPAMSQANILSYIILGQTLDNSDNFSKDQQQQLSSAALALALNGGSSAILQDVQNRFGITDISFGTIQQGQVLTDQLTTASSPNSQDPNQNNTALFVGKALSPHLYINYGVGIFTGEQLFQAIYRLNRNWRLQADYTSLDTGADIIYQFSID